MKNNTKPIVALLSGALLLGGLSQTAQAQNVIPFTTYTLADTFGTATGPEAITVTAGVNLSDGVYTYDYFVNNPVGNVLLNSDGSPTTTPEVVDAFSIAFDTSAPGAYIPNSQLGGVADQNNVGVGLFWSFTAINPGQSSLLLSFQSDDAPTFGDANAQDSNPPSPWSSLPDGQLVPVPMTVPEPATTTLLALTVFLLLPFRSTTLQLIRKRENVSLSK